MTTGRINQVTILNRRRSEGTPPRREADVSVTVKVGRRRIARPAAGIKRSRGALKGVGFLSNKYTPSEVGVFSMY